MTNDALTIADPIRRGDRSPERVASEAIRRIETLDPALNAVLHPRFERALAEAKRGPTGSLAVRDARQLATKTSFPTQRFIDAVCVAPWKFERVFPHRP